MNDRQLKYILAIEEKRSISAAAESLYISQPSLSAMLASVEKEVGALLFDRRATPLTLTYAGECYVEAARQILRINNNLNQQLSEIEDCQRGKLCIGCGHQFSAMLYPYLLPDFLTLYPKIQLKLRELTQSDVEKLQPSTDIDVFFSNSNVSKDFLEKELLYEEELVLLCPTSYKPKRLLDEPGHMFPCIDLKCARELPYVLMKPGLRIRGRIDQIFDDYGLSPQILLETSNWETCLNMASRGQTFTILPLSPLKRDVISNGNIAAYSISGKYRRNISLCWHKNAVQPKVVDAFIQFTRQHIRQIIVS